MFSSFKTLIVAFGFILFSLAANASTFGALSHSSSYDSTSNALDFTIKFNQVPDFLTTDSFGRQANVFAVYISGLDQSFYDGADIFGGGIHLTGDIQIYVNDSFGFRTILNGSVPFSLIGDTVSFGVSLPMLGLASAKDYKYRLETYSFGGITGYSDYYTTPPQVPLPAALPLMLSGLGVLGFASRRRKETF